MELELKISGLGELIRAAGWLATLEFLRAPMQAACEAIAGEAAIYPPASRKRMTWKSEKQRRFVMAGIRSGAIQVPYRRTDRLGQGWTTKVTSAPSELRGIVGNDIQYGPYVMDDKDQAAYHGGTWPVMGKIARAMEPTVVDLLEGATRTALNRI